MNGRIEGLSRARKQRSQKKRAAVEAAIGELREQGVPITFQEVAKRAKVSRQYLYNNFKAEIGKERKESRQQSEKIEGVTVPSRTLDECRYLEAVLRNKLASQTEELKQLRSQLRRLERDLEKERGASEHWRMMYTRLFARMGGRGE
jgi:AcrR family transcriptional regulator